MDQPILISQPHARALRKVLKKVLGRHFSWVYVGQSPDELERAKLRFHSHGTWLETTGSFHQAAEAVRDSYLTYLYDIGRELNSLRWWVTSLSCRNVRTGYTFHQVCRLKLALDLVNSWDHLEPLVVVVGDKPVWQAMRRNLVPGNRAIMIAGGLRQVPLARLVYSIINLLAHRSFFFLREVYRLYHSRRLAPRAQGHHEPVTLVISTVGSGNLDQGPRFHASYFGDLASQLREMGHHVLISPLVLRDVGYKEALLRLQAEPNSLTVPHQLLTLLDVIKTVLSTCMKPRLPRDIPRLCGLDISPLVQHDLEEHWISNRAPDAMLMAPLVRRWALQFKSIVRIIYIYENHPWERALCWEAKRSLPGTMLVGYQHSRVPRNYLSFYLARGGEKEAPLPDRVVTVGRHTARLLSSDGFDPPQVRVGGAIQMQNLLALRRAGNEPAVPSDGNTVLIVASEGLAEAAELVDLGVNLFNEVEHVSIVIKCHPLMPFRRIRAAGTRQLPKHVQVSDEPVIELMLRSSVMVYTGSTVSVQAMALGLPAVHLRPQFDLDLDPLEAVPEVRLEAVGLEELREKVDWLLEHRDEYIAEHRESWSGLVDDMYGAVTEESFRQFVD